MRRRKQDGLRITKARQGQILRALGLEKANKREALQGGGWLCYSLNHDMPTRDVPILLIERGPKNVTEIKTHLKDGVDAYIALFAEQGKIIFRVLDQFRSVSVQTDVECESMAAVLSSHNIADCESELDMQLKISEVIDAIPNATRDFDNRGLFPTHYLQGRIFDDVRRDVNADIEMVGNRIGGQPGEILKALGWNISGSNSINRMGDTSIVITDQDDFGIRKQESDIPPSYTALAELRNSRWAILTNGRKWRLYTNRISASSTNYFELTSVAGRDSTVRYLAAVFGEASHRRIDGVADIDIFFDEGRKYAKELEEDLANRIMSEDGVFLDIVRGVLDHDRKKRFGGAELECAKQDSLRIMYRIWFLAYAESRNLLPVGDNRYAPISLQSIHNRLDSYEAEPRGVQCWSDLLLLFGCVRDGSKEYNLPQYNGGLFRSTERIDGISVRNGFIAKALRGLLERDGEALDYKTLGVRHLGNVLETLMEFSIRQADRNIMLLKKGKKTIVVKTKQESDRIYRKNDLYLASKSNRTARKTTASYYTPDDVVKFLVRRGLEPLLAEREMLVGEDVKRYRKSGSEEDRRACVDRLLDIQVLDPTMGSGHFLVEALNRITMWVTDMLDAHQGHPLLDEIESDRRDVLSEQGLKDITIDATLLTDPALLKRRIMKRCIFGVDINPLAVELAKMSLWLDSFAIGVPFTYLDHHITTGDSTIGMRLTDMEAEQNHRVDDFIYPEKPSKLIESVGYSPDVTMDQLRASRTGYEEYRKQTRPQRMLLDAIAASRIDGSIIPAKKSVMEYLRRISDVDSGIIKHPDATIKRVIRDIRTKSGAYRFFHWELEMMDAFTDKRKGFDLITGNPPWDKVRPNKNEFFQNMYPWYKQEPEAEKQRIRKKHESEYQEYERRIEDRRAFYKKRGAAGEDRDYDLYRLVSERMLDLAAPNGTISMVMPSAIVNSRSATELRRRLMKMDIMSLHVLENRKEIFPIHRAYRFALLTVRNAKGPDVFPAGFYLQSVEEAEETGDRLSLSKKRIMELSPKMFMIYEAKNVMELRLVEKIHSSHPRLEDAKAWSVDLGREMNMGEEKDKKLVVKRGGWPVLESKDFHQHIQNYSASKYRADIRRTLKRTQTIAKFHEKSDEIHENPRLVYRSISSSTNTRTMVTCIAPQSVFTTINAYMAIPRIGMFRIDSDYHRLNTYLCGIFNSTTYDYIIRPKIDKAVATYQIYDTPVPEDFTGEVPARISRNSAILALSETWHEGMADALQVREDEAAGMTLNRRIDLTAEIDALAAAHYGLTRVEYELVLDSFETDDRRFTDAELADGVEYRKMSKGQRDKHMRMFYGEVYSRALAHYDRITGSGGRTAG